MAKYIIHGGKSLNGTIPIFGAKNSALKLLAAAILSDDASIIHNVPDIVDVRKMEEILTHLGADLKVDGDTVSINPVNITSTELDATLTKKIRASIVLAGPMLAKHGQVSIARPGGCLIGARSIDDHVDVFAQFGVKLQEDGEFFRFKGKPRAGEIILSKMSVSATENAIMTAVLSPGTTTIRVAAAEPEIADLAEFLNKMGAKITGAGTHNIIVEGVDKLHGAEHSVVPDRIEAATYLMMAIATKSTLKIGPVIPEHLSIVIKKLHLAGANFEIAEEDGKYYFMSKESDRINGVDIDTRTYPGFPTDLQSAYASLMTMAHGKTRIFETLFESRFGYIEELKQMNANIEVVSPHIINIYGTSRLRAADIDAFDIRGGAALVLAALATNGTTTLDHIEMIERGYESLDKKLSSVGADIQRTE